MTIKTLPPGPRDPGLVTHVDQDSMADYWAIRRFDYAGKYVGWPLYLVGKDWDGDNLQDNDYLFDMQVVNSKGVLQGKKGELDANGVRHSAFAMTIESCAFPEQQAVLRPLVRVVDGNDAYGDAFYRKLMPELPEEYGTALMATGCLEVYRTRWSKVQDDHERMYTAFEWFDEWYEINKSTSLSQFLELIPELDSMVDDVVGELVRTRNYIPRVTLKNPMFIPATNREWIMDAVAELKRGYMFPIHVRYALGADWLETFARTGFLYEYMALKRRLGKRALVREHLKNEIHSWLTRQLNIRMWMLKIQFDEGGNQIAHILNADGTKNRKVLVLVEAIKRSDDRAAFTAAVKRLGYHAYVSRRPNGAVGVIRVRGNARMDDDRILAHFLAVGETPKKLGGIVFCHSSGFMVSTNKIPSNVAYMKLAQSVCEVVEEAHLKEILTAA